jgi:hypothetical protein
MFSMENLQKSKLIIITVAMFTFILLAFQTGDEKSEYTLIAFGKSVTSGDFDLDGNMDIAVGHNYYWQTEWSGLSILYNDSLGIFNTIDTLFIDGGQEVVLATDVNGDNKPEIIGQYHDGIQSNAAIINCDEGNYVISYFPMCAQLTRFNIGDVSGDGFADIVFISNSNIIWGVIYNDGTGNFSAPVYYELEEPPLDIKCADFDNNGRSDVVIVSSYTCVHYSYETGFQQQILGYTWTGGCNIVVCDFDNDSKEDILVIGGVWGPHTRIYQFQNMGNTQFQQLPYFDFDPLTSTAQASDLNNDSLPELIFTGHNYEGLYIYSNSGNFQLQFNQFIPVINCSSRGLESNDFDGNGFNDLALLREGVPETILQVLFNDGQGNFVDEPIITETDQSEYGSSGLSCYPNPFSTIIHFRLNTIVDSEIIVSIYDLTGNLVYNSSGYSREGQYSFTWDAMNISNQKVVPGTYLSVIYVNDTFFKSVKILLI